MISNKKLREFQLEGIPTFKLKLSQFLIGNHNTYTDSLGLPENSGGVGRLRFGRLRSRTGGGGGGGGEGGDGG